MVSVKKSFYHYILKYRHALKKDEISEFANNVYDDHSFPKNSTNYNEISDYLEFNGHYLKSMSTFDIAWDLYELDEK
nr:MULTISPECIES: YozE family protein [Bacillus]